MLGCRAVSMHGLHSAAAAVLFLAARAASSSMVDRISTRARS
jgi:hypothetical protein